jgi:hypothetical protein
MTKTPSNAAALPASDKPKKGIARGFRYAGSISDQLSKLQVGECLTRAARLQPNEATPSHIQTIYGSLTTSLSSGLYRIERDSPGTSENYKTERGQFFTNDGALILVVAVSRIK